MPGPPDLNSYLASFAPPQETGPQSQEEIQYNRVLKLMAAMGLDPEDSASHTVFRELTGRSAGKLSRDFDEWENASAAKNWLGRNVAQKMLSKGNLEKFSEKARTRRMATEAAAQSTEFPWRAESLAPEIEQWRRVENKLRDPQALPRLEEWFQQIRRPRDIDRIPVENVTSKITY